MAVHDVYLLNFVEKLYSPVLNGDNPVVQHLNTLTGPLFIIRLIN